MSALKQFIFILLHVNMRLYQHIYNKTYQAVTSQLLFFSPPLVPAQSVATCPGALQSGRPEMTNNTMTTILIDRHLCQSCVEIKTALGVDIR